MRKLLFMLLIASLVAGGTAVFGATVGERAPSFTAPSHMGEISLADFAGKKHVVLAFYFKDFTSG